MCPSCTCPASWPPGTAYQVRTEASCIPAQPRGLQGRHIRSDHKVRKVLADFPVLDRWRYCKALCEVKFRQIEGNGLKVRQIEGNGLKVRQIELSNSVTDELYTNSAEAVQPNNSALLKGQCHDILTHNLFFFGETAHLHPWAMSKNILAFAELKS